jgi:hypothetical protein
MFVRPDSAGDKRGEYQPKERTPNQVRSDLMRDLDLDNPPFTFEGAVGVRRGAGYIRPWRLPPDDLDLHHPGLVFVASAPAGVRLRMATSTRAIALDVDQLFPPEWALDAAPRYDLVADGELLETADAPGGHQTVAFRNLPAGEKIVEVWLPMFPGVRIRRVAIDADATAAPVDDPRPRWIAYGSSITHCIEAHSPSRTWPATAARLLDWHLTSMGFAGMCHLDPLVARLIAQRPADHISLKLGINVHNMASLRERTFAPAVHGFLAAIRDGQPDTPITVISPILSPEREESGLTFRTTPFGEPEELPGDLTLQQMRAILEAVVVVRQRRGDAHLDYLDGRELFGEADLDHLPDGLHPDGEGYERMGRRFAERLSG